MEKSLHANMKGRRARAGGEKQYIHLLVTHQFERDKFSTILDQNHWISFKYGCTRHNFNKT